MAGNPLQELHGLGQSVWLDYLSRNIITTGKLQAFIDKGITGVTSNPSIFQKAISGSVDYDDMLRDLIDKGERVEKELFIALATRDIAGAADILLPVYESSGGEDGFVSIEVSPDLAYRTGETIQEAKRLFSALGKNNVLIKVPATREGLPAIETLIREGVNVNVTLLFAVRRYEEVMESYIRGLEQRVAAGKPVDHIFSVASFFVSRVDTAVDRMLEDRISAESSEQGKDNLRQLLGKAAVANAKIANKVYRQTFDSGRFGALKEKGAHVQKLLWGSTGTKNPAFSDVKYVEEIIARDSINTLPEATIAAFMDHGKPAVTIWDAMEEAEALFAKLSAAGIDIDAVTEQLEREGVQSFSDAFFSLLKEIAEKRDRFLST